MNKHAYILMGSQGSGKGTQASLLEDHLKRTDKETGVFNFDTGPALKALGRKDYHLSSRIHESLLNGELQPTFLAAYVWSQSLLEEYTGNEHLILQGSPRTVLEAEIINTALEYLELPTTVVFLSVSKEVVVERLHERGRDDDTEEAIHERLRWFDEKVLPVLDFYKNKEGYEVVEVDAGQSIEEVHKNVIKVLNL